MNIVTIKYKRGGKEVAMQKRYADVLVKVGQAVYFTHEEKTAPAPTKVADKALAASKPKKSTKPKGKKNEYKTRNLTAGDL